MNHWKKILSIAIILVGGTAIFGYWAINEFDKVFSRLVDTNNQVAKAGDLVSIVESSVVVSTSTDSTVSTSTPVEIAITTLISGYFDPNNFSIITPQKGNTLYVGCNYNVKWNEPNLLSDADLWVVNAETIEKVHPSTSLLSVSSTTEPVSNIDWKIGNIATGTYYILFSKINDQDFTYRSDKFYVEELGSDMTCPNL